MSKKFTEEQYQEIVEAWEEEYSYPNAMKSVIEKINEYAPLLPDFNTTNKAIAIANPLTREWAHEQFIEKEKKYVWYLKDNNSYRLNNHGGATQVNISHSTEDELTETEIRKWGYNPEMFDKEEVD